VVGLALAVNCLTFLLPPRYSLESQLGLHDRAVAQMGAHIGAEGPASTVLITDAGAAEARRHPQAEQRDHREGSQVPDQAQQDRPARGLQPGQSQGRQQHGRAGAGRAGQGQGDSGR